MSRGLRIVSITAGCVALLAIFLTITVVIVANSGWLSEKLRSTIVEQAEKATGGRVEIAKFHLNWGTLTAEIDGLVIHGTELQGQAPFLAVDHVTVGFRIISLLSRDIRLAHVEVTHPQVHLIIDAQGGTNLPKPKVPGKTNTADAILNLKINRFDVHKGEAFVESPGAPPRTYPWSGSGRNLEAMATYDPIHDKYAGDVQIWPAHFTLEGYGPLDVNVHAAAIMERNRVYVSKAEIVTPASSINLSEVNIGTFAAPVVTANYEVKASVAEAARVLHWKLPISGPLNVSGKARYISPTQFEFSGGFKGAGLSYSTLHNIRLSGNVSGNQDKLSLTGLNAGLLGGEATGTAETKGYDAYRVSGKISGLGVRSLAALGTPKPVPYDGLVSGTVDISGRIRDLSRSGLVDAKAQLTIAPPKEGPAVHGEISAHYTGSVAKLELGHSWIELPATRVDVTGTLGSTLAVSLKTSDVNDLLPALNGKALPFSLQNGAVSFTGNVTGALDDPHIAGRLDANNVLYSGKLIDSVGSDVTASMNQAAAANATVVYQGISASGAGSIALADWATSDGSAVAANLKVNNVDIGHALTVAGQKDVPVSGTISATAQLSGTLGQPVGTADLSLSKGLIYQQPYDAVTSHVQYVNPDRQTASGLFISGPKRVGFNISYAHAGEVMPAGTIEIAATSNMMALNQIALVKQRQPDIEGVAQFTGSGAIRVSRDAKNALHAEVTRLDVEGSAAQIGLGGRDFGGSHFIARTQGTTVTANFTSDAAGAVIQGQAKVELTGDDPANGSITFSKLGLNALAVLIVPESNAKDITFDGNAEGRIDFNGPLMNLERMQATATIPQIELHPIPGSALARAIPGFSLHNSEPLKVSYERSVMHVDSARFQAPQTDMSLAGTADFSNSSPLNLRLQGDVSLAMLRNFIPDLASSGTINVSATIRGSFSTPDLGGHASIRDGEFHYSDFSNGLTNANGEIVFYGQRAQIQSFTADTGGGKFTGSGFATLTGGVLAFQFSARTKDVRLRYPAGVSSVSDSDIQIVRNAERSSITGSVTVKRLVFNPQQDTAGMLADMSQNALVPPSGDNSFAGMNLDILIQTAPDVALQSKVAESIQADASLRLRGTVANPALLGRVNISSGSVLFFGNKYTISRGSISFFNPTIIDPILDVDLQTKARGVEVTLTVTGPPSHLGMSYRSDPPLEFSDIVALLATGRTPDDPSLALRGNAPTPSFEQLGASTLIGQTLANPVAGRLQRFFGVSRIKIDPQLAGVGGTPGARLTVEQQVTPDILFTYITDVSNTSQQLIRAEWSFNPKWSAILAREENGYVGVDFEYKRRFK